MEAKVYVNRTLNLRKIKYIGFDMDHTLVRYDSRAFENTTHDVVLQKLAARGYPKEILTLPFDYDLAIRGLVIDKRKGNLLKISRYGAIRASRHGLKAIDFATQKKMYSSTYIDLRDPRYSSVDTAFSISTANLFLQLVELKENQPKLNLPDFETMAQDLMACVDAAHRDDSLKSIVRANLGKYIIHDPAVVAGLERYRKHDKKIFVLTNSDFHYTKVLLDYAINPYLKEHKDWSELFEFVITAAQKPRFFYDDLKFLKVDPATGSMMNHTGALVPGVYQGGSAELMTRDLKLDGDDILYIGDHIYGDILRLKKDCNWRTAMVIEDLEAEIEKYQESAPIQKEIDLLMQKKAPLEEKHVALVTEKIEKEQRVSEDPAVQKLQEEISVFDHQIADLIRKQQNVFNKNWGEVMRAGNEESYFGYQVDRFACIYMAKISDLLALSPRTYFRAERRPMPHEL